MAIFFEQLFVIAVGNFPAFYEHNRDRPNDEDNENDNLTKEIGLNKYHNNFKRRYITLVFTGTFGKQGQGKIGRAWSGKGAVPSISLPRPRAFSRSLQITILESGTGYAQPRRETA